MTNSPRTGSRLGSSAILSGGHEADKAGVRSRTRRAGVAEPVSGSELSAAKSTNSLFASFTSASSHSQSSALTPDNSRNYNPRAASHSPASRRERAGGHSDTLGLLESSLTQSWTSLQGFASSLISGDGLTPRSATGQPTATLDESYRTQSQRSPEAWGPRPPGPRVQASDIGAGALAERQAALRAARTASVLESYEGVNGGLDTSGRYKRRTSDDFGSASLPEDAAPDQLVYIHHVQPTDTYAGIVLRYRCREEPFRRLNGLWSKDVQMRKWLALPVDFCDIKGRASDAPSHLAGGNIDYLAPTPTLGQNDAAPDDDFFSLHKTDSVRGDAQSEGRSWEHVRWCSLDSFAQPVEIGRVSKKSLGYFPPRRKKSLHTVSTVSSPRQSLDSSVIHEGVNSSPSREGGPSSRRQSLLGGRSGQPSTPTSGSIRTGGSGGTDSLPAWMRRPGGVGSMGRNVRAPGPERDYFNTWATRHLPGIAINEHVPSISVMGSESARFGFSQQARETQTTALVESPFDDGQDVGDVSRQGSGLDKAASQVEAWLRNAFAKRPGLPRNMTGNATGGRSQPPSDLIELEDTNSDDGRALEFGAFEASDVPSALRRARKPDDDLACGHKIAENPSKGSKEE